MICVLFCDTNNLEKDRKAGNLNSFYNKSNKNNWFCYNIMTWYKLLYHSRELQLVGTLNGGQSFRWAKTIWLFCLYGQIRTIYTFTCISFRWKHNEDTGDWVGVFAKTTWKVRQSGDCLEYKILGSLLEKPLGKTSQETMFKKLLEDYFRLDVKLAEYYKSWAEKDSLFKSCCEQFYGIRMLNQEPVENLFSFICSQNNHISR